MATHIRQLRTKVKINNKIGAGLIFTVPSVWSTSHPSDSEIKQALESQFGKDAGVFSSWSSSKYDILS
mgnify:CR=1 FL=1|jgi:hypothetical protein